MAAATLQQPLLQMLILVIIGAGNAADIYQTDTRPHL